MHDYVCGCVSVMTKLDLRVTVADVDGQECERVGKRRREELQGADKQYGAQLLSLSLSLLASFSPLFIDVTARVPALTGKTWLERITRTRFSTCYSLFFFYLFVLSFYTPKKKMTLIDSR